MTAWAQAELAEFFLLAGSVVLLARAPAALAARRLRPSAAGARGDLADRAWFPTVDGEQMPLGDPAFFTKAGAFVFGSGLAIVPFLYGASCSSSAGSPSSSSSMPWRSR